MSKPEIDNNNRGVLFRNDAKPGGADFSGRCEINHVEYYIDGWTRPMRDDPTRKFLTLRFKVKPKTPPPVQKEFDDEIPF